MTKKQILFFDFDGVIVDSFAMVLSCWQQMHPDLTEVQFRDLMRGNFYKNYEEAYPASQESHEEVYKRFFALYEISLLSLPPVPGMTSLLEDLIKDHALFVLSSSSEEPIRRFLKKHHLLSYFHDILGKESDEQKTVKMQEIFHTHETGPTRSLFVTDTTGDIIEGMEVGCQSIGVAWGFHSKEDLEQVHPFAVVSSVKELPFAIDEFFGRQSTT